MADRDVPPSPATLAGPGPVVLALRSGRGPFARAGSLPLASERVAVTNGGVVPIRVTGVAADPWLRVGRGTAAAGAALQAEMDGEATVPPGGSLVLRLGGRVPAQPGSYQSTLRLVLDAGAPVAIPVRADVAARSAWGIGLTLLGLIAAGLLAGLGEEGAVADKLRDTLQRREATLRFAEAHWIDAERPELQAANRAWEAAVATLSRPRSVGWLDHRLEDAAGSLAEADALAAGLRQGAAGPGAADAVLAPALVPWQALQPQLRALGAPTPSGPDTGRLDAVLNGVRERLVAAPARWLEAELTAQTVRLRLVAAAGEADAAWAEARASGRAMARAARALAAGQRLVMRQQAQLAFLGGTVAEIERGIADPALPAARREALAAALTAAWAELPPGAGLDRLLPFSRAVEAAATQLLTAAIEAERAAGEAAVRAVAAATERPPAVDAAMAAAQADPDRSAGTKAAHLRAVLTAWQEALAPLPPAERAPLLAQAAAMEAALARNDRDAAAAAYGLLEHGWADYGDRQVHAAAGGALQPFCDRYAAGLQRRLGYLDQLLRWEEAGPLVAEWDRQRDRVRLQLNRAPAGEGCLPALLAADTAASALNGDMIAAGANTSGVAAAVRAEALAGSGVGGAGPRRLAPRTDTPPGERSVGRPLRVAVDELDPDWGAGTAVRLDWGDGTPPWVGDAEQVRRTPPTHAYARPLAAPLRAVATLATAAAADRAEPAVIGEGAATLLIGPAPDSAARALADRFLTARFGVALFIALLIYSWRFQARDRVFGARPFDYAEAFALGFAVNAAVAELPAGLAKLALG